ncbi:MAG: outer membrane protein transport protein [Syntrophorhabdales bacterium]|jgi:long-chain fatty acid transport protein
MKKMKKPITTFALLLQVRSLPPIFFLIALLLYPGQLLASGFIIYNQDAKADGMATAVTSSIDNPSAIFYNPALLPDQPGFGVSMNDTMVMPSRTFKDAATGTTADLKPATHHVPSFFAKYTRDQWSLGIGVYSPFGLSADWGRNWIGRYSTTFAELKSTFVTPTVAYKFNDRISAGFGVSYVDSSVDLQSAIPLTPFPDGEAKLSGDGSGVGANAGIRVKLPQDYTLSFTARSPVKIKYDGTANFYTPALFKALVPQLRDTNASTTITLPWQMTAGLAKKFGALTLETDITYLGWSTIDHYTAHFSDGRPPVIYLKDWHDAFSFAIGANYRWSKSFETQLGYMYDMSPVPQRTLTPDLPDADKHILTGGIGYIRGPFRANLAYQATFFNKVSSVGNIVGAPAGTYDQFIHMVLFTLTYAR